MHHPYQPTTEERDDVAGIRFDATYLLNPKGILKLAEIIVAFVGYCIILVSHLNNFIIGEFLGLVCASGLCITGVFICLYVFHIVETLDWMPWLKIEFGMNAILTAFYIASAVLGTYSATDMGKFIPCAIVGYIEVILYGADTFINLDNIRKGAPPQVPREPTYRRAPFILT